MSGPEQLNDHIRVTTPGVWLVLLSLVILLPGMLAWSIPGSVEAVGANRVTESFHPIALVMN